MAQLRSWVFTINNYNELDEKGLKDLTNTYVLYAYEVGEGGTPHLQGYLYTKDKISRKALSKKIPRANLSPANGTLEEQKAYIIGPYQKDGKNKPYNPNYITYGTEPSQGQRKDLDLLKDKILEGQTTTDNIALETPMLYHQYARTLTKIEDIAMRRKFRTEMTIGIWYHGPTATGKSSKAYEGFNPMTHYNWKEDNGWQDGYTQQETVIIDEFRGEMPYRQLLRLVNSFPYELSRRNREPMPFISKKVIITSSLHPSEIYKNLNEKDSLEQLFRRFEIIELKKT